eukprot:COSAG05_NODE_25667_length_194_cov_115.073684_1_plen_52_part_01
MQSSLAPAPAAASAAFSADALEEVAASHVDKAEALLASMQSGESEGAAVALE